MKKNYSVKWQFSSILIFLLCFTATQSRSQNNFSTFQAADLVIGQTSFSGSSGACTQLSTNGPSYCAISSKGMLAVANQAGYRVQLWTSPITGNGQLPSFVLGKNSFTDCSGGLSQSLTGSPNGLGFSPDGNKILISDYSNNRVLIWNTIPVQNGKPADVVLGQNDFTSSASGVAANKFDGPMGIYVSSDGKLFISDYNNNRVLIWNEIPTQNGTPADIVVGQPDFTSSTTGNAANKLDAPWGIWVSPDGKLLVAEAGSGGGDGNNRVVVFNTIPVANNASADVVIGQTAFGISTSGLSQTKFSNPIGVTVSPNGILAISDFSNSRVLIYNSIPTSNGAAADVVLGQPDFTSSSDFYPGGTPTSQNMSEAYNVSFDLNGRLFVAGRGMNRLMVFGTLPSQQSDLQIEISLGTSTFCPGASSTIGFIITNNGPDTATGIVATASLPASFSYDSSSTDSGNYNPGSGYWNISSLAPGATATLNVTGTSTASGIYTSYANIIQSGQLDTNLNNNASSIDYNVNCPCSGTPTGGTAVSNDTAICPGVDFTLSLSGATDAGNLTYQWQFSTDSVNFNDVTSGTTLSLTTNITAATLYRCVVTCTNSGLTSISNTVWVIVNPVSACFCVPEAATYSCQNSWITNVTTTGGISDFNNTSNCGNSTYTDFSGSISASNIQSSTTTMNFTSTGNGMAYSVWIDYNDNGNFETSEKVISNDNPTGNLSVTDSFAIPLSTPAGPHIMRVRSEQYYYDAPTDPCSKLIYGETEDYTFTVISLTPCSGTPIAGNTISSATTVCEGINFTLSLQGATLESGLTFQWQSSSDSINYTDITGATNLSLILNQSSTTYYQCVVTCTDSGLSAISSPVLVTMNPFSDCFCIPDPTTYTCQYMWITNISTSGGSSDFNNNSDCGTSDYEDFSGSISASNVQSGTTTMSFTSYGYAMAYSVWIDFNDNGTFEGSEQMIANDNPSGNLTVTDTVTIPLSAPAGSHMMRIRSEYYSNGAPTDPCNSLEYGETEDYSFTVISLTPCAGTPSAGNAISSTSVACNGINFTLGLQGATLESGLTIQWQSGTDTLNFTNISGATNPNLTLAQTLATFYRCIITCTDSNLSDTSGSVLVSITNDCYCESKASSSSDEEIFNVTVGTLNNTSSCSTTGGTGSIINQYSDYTGIVAAPDLMQGATVGYSIEIGSCGGDYSSGTAIFIDYNQNGNFNDAGEMVYGTPGTTNGPYTFNGNFDVPISALTGITRMRIINAENYSGISIDPCQTYTYGETEEYWVNIFTPTPCTGTPVQSQTESNLNPVCAGDNFVLSLPGTTFQSGLTFQWQSSQDTLNFSNINGATAQYLTSSQTSATYYRCIVTCADSGLSSISIPVLVDMNSITACFCIPAASTYSCQYMWITNVFTSGGITDFNNSSACGNDTYTDYSGSYSSSNIQLSTTSMTFTSYGYELGYSVWIDYNDNGTFEGSEMVITNDNTAGSMSLTDSFTIPLSATPGAHKMRVRSEYNTDGAPTDPCNTLNYGETEDYSFTVISLTPCSGTPTAGNTISSTNLVCADTAFTLSLQGTSMESGLTYQWQSSLDSLSFTDIAGATNSTLTQMQTSATFYRCVVTCTAGGLFDNSTSIKIGMSTDCYCISMASTDFDEDIFNVTVGTMNNSSNCTTTGGAGSIINVYSDYTETVAPPVLTRGSAVPISIQIGTCGGDYNSGTAVFIDYNQNGTFADAGEKVLGITGTSIGPHTVNGNFTIPTSAIPGNTRMRVINEENATGSSITACGTFGYGETEDYTITIQADDIPPVGNFSFNILDVCQGIVQFTGVSNPNPTTWLWIFGDGDSSSLQSPFKIYSNGGNFDVTLIVTNNYGADTIIKSVSINKLAGGIISPDSVYIGNSVPFFDNSPGATGWTWDFGDGGNSTLQNPNHIYTATGTFTVELTVTDGTCNSVVSKPVFVDFPTGKDFVSGNEFVLISPNPANLKLNIRYTFEGTKNLKVTIQNVLGQISFLENAANVPDYNRTLDISSFPKGIYLILVNNGEKIRTSMVVIE